MLSLFTHVSMPSPQVHKIFPSGVAAQEGSIKAGDPVLSINGSSLSDLVHWEVLRVLRRAKARETGVVVLRKGGISGACEGAAQSNSPQPEQTQFTDSGLSSYSSQYLIDNIESQHLKGTNDVFVFFLLSQVSVFVCVWRRWTGIWASAWREV